MSDMTRPEGLNSQNLTPENSVFHSGKLPGSMSERPTEEFDNTTLEEAHERNLISPLPEHPGDLPEASQITQPEADKSSRNKLGLFIGGGLLALAAAGIGFLMGQDNDQVEASSATPSTQPVIEDTVPTTTPETTTTTSVESMLPLENVEFGNLHLSEAFRPGEDFVAATRPNGEVIQVPKLRSLDDPDAFAESALALLACYVNTGNEDCLQEFSTEPTVQNYLMQLREGHLTQVIEPQLGYTTFDNFQLVYYDEASDPVTFRYNPNTEFFTLDSGTLKEQLSDDEQWQGVESTAAWYGQEVESFSMRVDRVPSEPGRGPHIYDIEMGFRQTH